MSEKYTGNWGGGTEQIKETPGTDSERGLENVWIPSTPHKVISMFSHKDVTESFYGTFQLFIGKERLH